MITYQKAIEEWQRISKNAYLRGKKIDDARHAKAWALAASVGIGRCGCSLHNASIDDNMTGWCKGNPIRLRVAKQASYLLSQWNGSKLAQRISNKAWNRLLVPFGCPTMNGA